MNHVPRHLKITWTFLLALFCCMLFFRLGQKPIHHDESVNASFMKKLIEGKGYKYDPENYHGPDLYYFQLIPTWISNLNQHGIDFEFSSTDGLNPFALRTGVAVSGALLLMGLLGMRPVLGLWGTTLALILAGFSGNLLYFSRYFIHESYVLLFTFGVYLSGLYFGRTKKARYLYWGAASASLLFCTKETSLVTLFILGFSYLLSEAVYWLLNNKRAPTPWSRLKNQISSTVGSYKIHLLFALLVAVFIWATFFTSFFTNPRGLIDSFRSYTHWTQEGIESVHEKPFHYYINNILTRYDLILLILSFVGLIAAVLRKNRHGIFLVFWTLGMVGFYSLTPYKTPWLVINMILPMILLSGFAFESAIKILDDSPLAVPRSTGIAAILVAMTAVFVLQLPHNLKLVYSEYDNDAHPQVYAHTSRTIFGLIDRIDSAAKSPRGGKDMTINVFVDKFWPLPYYLRDYTNVRYHKNFENLSDVDGDIVLVDAYRKKRLETMLRRNYTVKFHSIRSGVPVVVFIDNKFIDQNAFLPKQLLTSTMFSKPTRGLIKEQFKGTTFSGVASPEKESLPFPFAYARTDRKPFNGSLSARWTGYIRIPVPGLYKFTLESDDGSWLRIDDVEIIDNGGEHALTRASGSAELSEGLHKIEIKYFDVGGEAVLKLFWMVPGGIEALVPLDYFFNDAP